MHRAFDLKPTKIDADAALKSGLTKRLCEDIIYDLRAAVETNDETNKSSYTSPSNRLLAFINPYSSEQASVNAAAQIGNELMPKTKWEPTKSEIIDQQMSMSTRLTSTSRDNSLLRKNSNSMKSDNSSMKSDKRMTSKASSRESIQILVEPAESDLDLPLEIAVMSERFDSVGIPTSERRGSVNYHVPNKFSIAKGLIRKDSDGKSDGKSDVSSLDFVSEKAEESLFDSHASKQSYASGSLARDKQPPIKYNRLATPRNHRVSVCDVCNKVARYQCDACRSSFYCSLDHYYDDINHSVLCQDLRELQRLRKEGEKNDDPFKRQFFVRSMVTQKESCLKKILYSAVYCIANNQITTANYTLNQALVSCKEMFGPGAVQCLEILMLKSQCSCIMGNVKDAKQEMGLAEIVIEHNPELATHEDVKADMSYIAGLCYMVQGDFDQARFFLSDSIYWRSFSNSPTTVISVRCFFCMGEIAEFSEDWAMANSIYEHCLQDYQDWLLMNLDSILSPVVKQFHVKATAFEFNPISMPLLIEGDVIKGIKKLISTYETEKDHRYYKCILSLAIFCFLKGDFVTANNLIKGCKTQLQWDLTLTRYIKRMTKVMGGYVSNMAPQVMINPVNRSDRRSAVQQI